MFASAIKNDVCKVPKATTKPRTASLQEGGDDVANSANSITEAQSAIRNKENLDQCTSMQHLLIGSMLL